MQLPETNVVTWRDDPHHFRKPGRREFLRVGVVGALGLSLGDFLRHEARTDQKWYESKEGQAKGVIQIVLPGGMAHQESWDPKPEAPLGSICEHLASYCRRKRCSRLRLRWHRRRLAASASGQTAHSDPRPRRCGSCRRDSMSQRTGTRPRRLSWFWTPGAACLRLRGCLRAEPRCRRQLARHDPWDHRRQSSGCRPSDPNPLERA